LRQRGARLSKGVIVNNLKNLLDRINAEAAITEERIKRRHQERVDTFERRRQRHQELFLPAWNRLKKVWLPRLRLLEGKIRALAKNLGESVRVIPEIRPNEDAPHSGEMSFVCESSLARIQVKFGFFHDTEVRNLVMDYALVIIPVFLKFEPHSRQEQTVESFDADVAAQWLDDRIVDFVRTYLAIHENSTYTADHLVEDPIAHVRFSKHVAKNTLHKEGITYYFISPETKRAFENGCHWENNAHHQNSHLEVRGS